VIFDDRVSIEKRFERPRERSGVPEGEKGGLGEKGAIAIFE
jgi:hypothetical protein